MRYLAAVMPVVLLLSAACKDEPNVPLKDRGPPAVTPPFRPGDPLLGALPAPIGKVSTADFRAALTRLNMPSGSWNGGSGQRRCTDALLCGLGKSKVPVTIEPAIDVARAGADNVGPNGAILARVQNTGDKKTGGYSGYKLEPGQMYYFVVASSGAGAKWQLVPFSDRQTQDPASVWEGTFKDCGHDAQPTAPRAGFYTCDQSKKQAMAKASLLEFSAFNNAVLHAVGWAQSFFDLDQSPGWVSCAYGCCTLSW